MVGREPQAVASLYEVDETAWLDRTAESVRCGRFEEIDTEALAEFLTDLAKRDRREVFSRLVVLLVHLLKWEYQPERRSGSWQGTMLEQQRELRQLLDSGTLRAHALAVLAETYAEARKQAAAETGLARTVFSGECPWDLDEVLADRGEVASP